MWDINEFTAVTIRIASPEKIRSWSHGEVRKPETINYRTLKPELEGLFCERIFGSTKDWECYCGKFKGIRYKGVICDRCNVEVTHSKVRRERMGHIELVAPVSHIWFFKIPPSRIGSLLSLSVRELDRVLYFQDYIVLDPGDSKTTGLKKKQLLTEDDHRALVERIGERGYKVGMGAEAIRELLKEIDPPKIAGEIRAQLKMKNAKQEEKILLRQLSVAEAFAASGARPEWMILEVLPVLPPELRPMVQLDGGRFATSDLNDLYRRIINRNNRLRRLIDLKAPQIIIRNEKRMLQEAVDALFDNGRRGRPVKGASNNRVLKSFAEMLKGKQGRFRQNLLGKRVDYSGRSVIVVGPRLALSECGLPKKMALELFKPFLMKELVKRGLSPNIKAAKRLVERESPEVWEVIEDVIRDHPVLLNRAPTLHRLGIQAFYPKLVEGKAIWLHPLVCPAYNADFDGDQMAVHVPLSAEAITEAHVLMLAPHNLLSPANGNPIVTPTQDIVLGIYYLTKDRESEHGTGRAFSSPSEALAAFDRNVIGLHARVRVRIDGRIVETTAGRLLFNEVLPKGTIPFVNKTIAKKDMTRILDEVYRREGQTVTARTVDRIKDIGFMAATRSGVSIGIEDLRIPAQKDELIDAAMKEVEKIESQFKKGVITDQERYTKVIDTWTHVTDEVAKVMFDEIENDQEGFNPVFVMADSGARGSKAQMKQLSGMRGLMADPFGRIREIPILSNFREGLSVIEFFHSTTGARKGLTDTALKTANAGYLTRRLVDTAQDVVVASADCGTSNGIPMEAVKMGDDIVEPLSRRALGRVLAIDCPDPGNEEKVLLPAGTILDEETAKVLETAGVASILVRSALTCDADHGICRMCYGRDLATGRLVELGEAVGVVAAQSIGEPGTQLTVRTFHVGGTAAADDTYLRSRFTAEVTEIPAIRKEEDGTEYTFDEAPILGKKIERLEVAAGTVAYVNAQGHRQVQAIRKGSAARFLAKEGEIVKAGQDVLEIVLEAPDAGTIRAVRKDSVILSGQKRRENRVDIPAGLRICVVEGEKVEEGASLARRAFPASFGSKVRLKEKQMTLVAEAATPISAITEKGRLVEAEARIGCDPRVKVGERVEAGQILGVNPGYQPILASFEGQIDFSGVSLVQEGNESIITQPDGGSAVGATATVWEGESYVIGPIANPPAIAGKEVKPGEAICPGGPVAANSGTVHILRRYVLSRSEKEVLVVRVIRRQEKKNLPYLRYTKTAQTAGRSRALSRVKRQNIKLISKSVLFLREAQKASEAETRERARVWDDLHIALPEDAETHSGGAETAIVRSLEGLEEIAKKEASFGKNAAKRLVERGQLVVKLFSDFLHGAKDAGGEASGQTRDITGGLPRVEELFELRPPKSTPAVLSAVSGTVHLGAKFRKDRILEIVTADGAEPNENEIPDDRDVIVAEGQEVEEGTPLTDGPIDPKALLRVKGVIPAAKYIVDAVQNVYRMQGVDIQDKHMEVITRQMLRRVRILDAHDTAFLNEELVERTRLKYENARVIKEKKKPATFENVLLGLTKVGKNSESWIASASFQETTGALTRASLQGKKDNLLGLKENVVIGHLIPSGTGFRKYRKISLETPKPEPKIVVEEGILGTEGGPDRAGDRAGAERREKAEKELKEKVGA